MTSYVCATFLLIMYSNFLQTNFLNITSGIEQIIQSDDFSQAEPIDDQLKTIQWKNEERTKVIMDYQSQLERKNKLSRGIKNIEEFWKKRNKLATSEVRLLLGNSLPLDEKELEANKIILSKKFQEYDMVLNSTNIFPTPDNLWQTNELMEKSEIFEIIKQMPKGANIYGTLLSSVDFEFMYQLTFDDDLYFRFDDKLHLKYSKTRPGSGWGRLSYLRNRTGKPEYIEDLNNAIKEYLIIDSTQFSKVNQLNLMKKYADVVEIYLSLVKYRPNFAKILKKALELLYEDNIMYAELDFQFPELYDLDGKVYNPVSVLRFCRVIVDDFIRTHKNFIGMRFIYTSNTTLNSKNLTQFRKTAKELWKANPNLIAGFGITVDKEPLSDWVEELLKFPKEMKMFLNTGFTKNWGIHADYNILDALVLNPSSIGEPLAITKHPFVLEKLRDQGVPIKFSPVFAQTFKQVENLNDHPLNILLATNYPIVIGNVAGSVVNCTDLSYHWYKVYMEMTPRFCDIRCLKQLAINSLMHTSLPSEEKIKSILAWQKKWEEFVEGLIDSRL